MPISTRSTFIGIVRLILQVNDDLLGKESWSNLRSVLLELPPCRKRGNDKDETPSSCQQRRNDDGTRTSREHDRCSCNTAHGIAATIVEDVEDGISPSTAASITTAVVVFAVNAGCPLPTPRRVQHQAHKKKTGEFPSDLCPVELTTYLRECFTHTAVYETKRAKLTNG